MARIRSIHPGLFTDPEFASLSDAAQVFYLGLLTEADDNGIFDWNPGKLRIRLRPGKDGGVEKLLSELEAADKVRSYEHGGRKLGAIRNFRRFQKPKSPKSWFFIPHDFRNYVGLSQSISTNGGDDGPKRGNDSTSASPISENPFQREEKKEVMRGPPSGDPPDSEYHKSSLVAAREDGPAGADAHDIKTLLSKMAERKRA